MGTLSEYGLSSHRATMTWALPRGKLPLALFATCPPFETDILMALCEQMLCSNFETSNEEKSSQNIEDKSLATAFHACFLRYAYMFSNWPGDVNTGANIDASLPPLCISNSAWRQLMVDIGLLRSGVEKKQYHQTLSMTASRLAAQETPKAGTFASGVSKPPAATGMQLPSSWLIDDKVLQLIYTSCYAASRPQRILAGLESMDSDPALIRDQKEYILEHQDRNKVPQKGLSEQSFALALARVALWRAQRELFGPNSTHLSDEQKRSMFSPNSPLGLTALSALRSILAFTPQLDMDKAVGELLLHPLSLLAIKDAEETLLHQLFLCYASRAPGTTKKSTGYEYPVMKLASFFQLCADLTVCPGYVSRHVVCANVFRVSKLLKPLDFPQFLEAITRIALAGYYAHSPYLIPVLDTESGNPTTTAAAEDATDRMSGSISGTIRYVPPPPLSAKTPLSPLSPRRRRSESPSFAASSSNNASDRSPKSTRSTPTPSRSHSAPGHSATLSQSHSHTRLRSQSNTQVQPRDSLTTPPDTSLPLLQAYRHQVNTLNPEHVSHALYSLLTRLISHPQLLSILKRQTPLIARVDAKYSSTMLFKNAGKHKQQERNIFQDAEYLHTFNSNRARHRTNLGPVTGLRENVLPNSAWNSIEHDIQTHRRKHSFSKTEHSLVTGVSRSDIPEETHGERYTLHNSDKSYFYRSGIGLQSHEVYWKDLKREAQRLMATIQPLEGNASQFMEYEAERDTDEVVLGSPSTVLLHSDAADSPLESHALESGVFGTGNGATSGASTMQSNSTASPQKKVPARASFAGPEGGKIWRWQDASGLAYNLPAHHSLLSPTTPGHSTPASPHASPHAVPNVNQYNHPRSMPHHVSFSASLGTSLGTSPQFTPYVPMDASLESLKGRWSDPTFHASAAIHPPLSHSELFSPVAFPSLNNSRVALSPTANTTVSLLASQIQSPSLSQTPMHPLSVSGMGLSAGANAGYLSPNSRNREFMRSLQKANAAVNSSSLSAPVSPVDLHENEAFSNSFGSHSAPNIDVRGALERHCPNLLRSTELCSPKPNSPGPASLYSPHYSSAQYNCYPLSSSIGFRSPISPTSSFSVVGDNANGVATSAFAATVHSLSQTNGPQSGAEHAKSQSISRFDRSVRGFQSIDMMAIIPQVAVGLDEESSAVMDSGLTMTMLETGQGMRESHQRADFPGNENTIGSRERSIHEFTNANSEPQEPTEKPLPLYEELAKKDGIVPNVFTAAQDKQGENKSIKKKRSSKRLSRQMSNAEIEKSSSLLLALAEQSTELFLSELEDDLSRFSLPSLHSSDDEEEHASGVELEVDLHDYNAEDDYTETGGYSHVSDSSNSASGSPLHHRPVASNATDASIDSAVPDAMLGSHLYDDTSTNMHVSASESECHGEVGEESKVHSTSEVEKLEVEEASVEVEIPTIGISDREDDGGEFALANSTPLATELTPTSSLSHTVSFAQFQEKYTTYNARMTNAREGGSTGRSLSPDATTSDRKDKGATKDVHQTRSSSADADQSGASSKRKITFSTTTTTAASSSASASATARRKREQSPSRAKDTVESQYFDRIFSPSSSSKTSRPSHAAMPNAKSAQNVQVSSSTAATKDKATAAASDTAQGNGVAHHHTQTHSSETQHLPSLEEFSAPLSCFFPSETDVQHADPPAAPYNDPPHTPVTLKPDISSLLPPVSDHTPEQMHEYQQHPMRLGVVDEALLPSLLVEFAPILPRLKAVYLHYCRLKNPANSGILPLENLDTFFQDIQLYHDASIVPEQVDAQIAFVLRKEAHLLQSRMTHVYTRNQETQGYSYIHPMDATMKNLELDKAHTTLCRNLGIAGAIAMTMPTTLNIGNTLSNVLTPVLIQAPSSDNGSASTKGSDPVYVASLFHNDKILQHTRTPISYDQIIQVGITLPMFFEIVLRVAELLRTSNLPPAACNAPSSPGHDTEKPTGSDSGAGDGTSASVAAAHGRSLLKDAENAKTFAQAFFLRRVLPLFTLISVETNLLSMVITDKQEYKQKLLDTIQQLQREKEEVRNRDATTRVDSIFTTYNVQPVVRQFSSLLTKLFVHAHFLQRKQQKQAKHGRRNSTSSQVGSSFASDNLGSTIGKIVMDKIGNASTLIYGATSNVYTKNAPIHRELQPAMVADNPQSLKMSTNHKSLSISGYIEIEPLKSVEAPVRSIAPVGIKARLKAVKVDLNRGNKILKELNSSRLNMDGVDLDDSSHASVIHGSVGSMDSLHTGSHRASVSMRPSGSHQRSRRNSAVSFQSKSSLPHSVAHSVSHSHSASQSAANQPLLRPVTSMSVQSAITAAASPLLQSAAAPLLSGPSDNGAMSGGNSDALNRSADVLPTLTFSSFYTLLKQVQIVPQLVSALDAAKAFFMAARAAGTAGISSDSAADVHFSLQEALEVPSLYTIKSSTISDPLERDAKALEQHVGSKLFQSPLVAAFGDAFPEAVLPPSAFPLAFLYLAMSASALHSTSANGTSAQLHYPFVHPSAFTLHSQTPGMRLRTLLEAVATLSIVRTIESELRMNGIISGESVVIARELYSNTAVSSREIKKLEARQARGMNKSELGTTFAANSVGVRDGHDHSTDLFTATAQTTQGSTASAHPSVVGSMTFDVVQAMIEEGLPVSLLLHAFEGGIPPAGQFTSVFNSKGEEVICRSVIHSNSVLRLPENSVARLAERITPPSNGSSPTTNSSSILSPLLQLSFADYYASISATLLHSIGVFAPILHTTAIQTARIPACVHPLYLQPASTTSTAHSASLPLFAYLSQYLLHPFIANHWSIQKETLPVITPGALQPYTFSSLTHTPYPVSLTFDSTSDNGSEVPAKQSSKEPAKWLDKESMALSASFSVLPPSQSLFSNIRQFLSTRTAESTALSSMHDESTATASISIPTFGALNMATIQSQALSGYYPYVDLVPSLTTNSRKPQTNKEWNHSPVPQFYIVEEVNRTAAHQYVALWSMLPPDVSQSDIQGDVALAYHAEIVSHPLVYGTSHMCTGIANYQAYSTGVPGVLEEVEEELQGTLQKYFEARAYSQEAKLILRNSKLGFLDPVAIQDSGKYAGTAIGLGDDKFPDGKQRNSTYSPQSLLSLSALLDLPTGTDLPALLEGVPTSIADELLAVLLNNFASSWDAADSKPVDTTHASTHAEGEFQSPSFHILDDESRSSNNSTLSPPGRQELVHAKLKTLLNDTKANALLHWMQSVPGVFDAMEHLLSGVSDAFPAASKETISTPTPALSPVELRSAQKKSIPKGYGKHLFAEVLSTMPASPPPPPVLSSSNNTNATKPTSSKFASAPFVATAHRSGPRSPPPSSAFQLQLQLSTPSQPVPSALRSTKSFQQAPVLEQQQGPEPRQGSEQVVGSGSPGGYFFPDSVNNTPEGMKKDREGDSAKANPGTKAGSSAADSISMHKPKGLSKEKRLELANLLEEIAALTQRIHRENANPNANGTYPKGIVDGSVSVHSNTLPPSHIWGGNLLSHSTLTPLTGTPELSHPKQTDFAFASNGAKLNASHDSLSAAVLSNPATHLRSDAYVPEFGTDEIRTAATIPATPMSGVGAVPASSAADNKASRMSHEEKQRRLRRLELSQVAHQARMVLSRGMQVRRHLSTRLRPNTHGGASNLENMLHSIREAKLLEGVVRATFEERYHVRSAALEGMQTMCFPETQERRSFQEDSASSAASFPLSSTGALGSDLAEPPASLPPLLSNPNLHSIENEGAGLPKAMTLLAPGSLDSLTRSQITANGLLLGIPTIIGRELGLDYYSKLNQTDNYVVHKEDSSPFRSLSPVSKSQLRKKMKQKRDSLRVSNSTTHLSFSQSQTRLYDQAVLKQQQKREQERRQRELQDQMEHLEKELVTSSMARKENSSASDANPNVSASPGKSLHLDDLVSTRSLNNSPTAAGTTRSTSAQRPNYLQPTLQSEQRERLQQAINAQREKEREKLDAIRRGPNASVPGGGNKNARRLTESGVLDTSDSEEIEQDSFGVITKGGFKVKVIKR